VKNAGRWFFDIRGESNEESPTPVTQNGCPRSGSRTHGGPINAAVFSRDGGRILTLCADGVARLWDPAARARQPLLELAGRHTGPLLCGAFSNDGNWIATAGEDKQIILWDAHTGQPALDSPLQGHSAAITSLAFSEDGKRLLTGSRDNTAKLWDLRVVEEKLHGKELLTLRGHSAEVTSVAFSPDGRFVLTASLDSTAILWLTNRP
jgi:WD40 repeat protein